MKLGAAFHGGGCAGGGEAEGEDGAAVGGCEASFVLFIVRPIGLVDGCGRPLDCSGTISSCGCAWRLRLCWCWCWRWDICRFAVARSCLVEVCRPCTGTLVLEYPSEVTQRYDGSDGVLSWPLSQTVVWRVRGNRDGGFAGEGDASSASWEWVEVTAE